jgi:hypothetical protein
MSATIIPFVPRNSVDRKPMLEQLAHELIEQITVPTCHDDLTGNSILEYESSLGYLPKEPA